MSHRSATPHSRVRRIGPTGSTLVPLSSRTDPYHQDLSTPSTAAPCHPRRTQRAERACMVRAMPHCAPARAGRRHVCVSATPDRFRLLLASCTARLKRMCGGCHQGTGNVNQVTDDVNTGTDNVNKGTDHVSCMQAQGRERAVGCRPRERLKSACACTCFHRKARQMTSCVANDERLVNSCGRHRCAAALASGSERHTAAVQACRGPA